MKLKDQEDVRSQIVEGAREVFAKYGYRKTTIEDIASSVYKAKSSVYHYFGGKEDIFRAVINSEAAHIFSKLRDAVRREETPVEKFNAYFTTVHEGIRETVNFFRLIIDEWFAVFDFAREAKADYEQHGIEILSGILREGNESGIFAVDHPETSAKAIIVAFNGFWFPLGNEIRDTGESVEPFLNIILRGVLKR